MVDSSATRIDQIESWFRMHDDGEFSVLPPDPPSSQIGNFAIAPTIVYTTKQHCVARIKGLSQFGEPIATIGRYGLPVRCDLPLLRGSVQCPIFIGDCDPPDPSRLLQVLCPDYRQLLGPYCSSLLDAGFKIEVEGAIIDRSVATKC